MKIKYLIERLQEFDQELTVLVDGYEGGYSDIDIILKHVRKHYIDYQGDYDDCRHREGSNCDGFQALILERQ